MNIGYISSDYYAPILGVSLTSLLEKHKSLSELKIHIADDGISEDNKKAILKVASDYSRELEFYSCDGLSDFVCANNLSTFRQSHLTYAKIFPHLVFDVNDRMIIIDCDTIINQDISELYTIDLDDSYVAAVPELTSKYKSSEDPSIKNKNLFYFNTGVLLWDINKAKSSEFTERAIAQFSKYGSPLKLADQSLFNLTVETQDVKPLHYKFNYNCNLNVWPEIRYKVQKEYADLGLGYDNINFKKTLPSEMIAIVHYLGSNRPWIFGSFAPYAYLYLKIWRKSYWRGNKRESYFNKLLIEKIKKEPYSIFSNKYLGYAYVFCQAVKHRFFQR